MTAAFANPDVHVQSWYTAARSSAVRRGRALSIDMLGRRIALWRGQDGCVRALEARCAHMGADLGQGQVVGDDLRCAFHHWRYDGTGRCVDVPALDAVPAFARAASYAVEERHGLVFLFNAPQPAFPLPSFDGWDDADLVPIRLPARRMRCHPHLAIANGLDVEHYRTVHGLDFLTVPVVEEPAPHRVRIRLELRLPPADAATRALRLLAGDTFTAIFSTWGGSMATIEGHTGSTPLLLLFTHRGDGSRGSESQTVLFWPRARLFALPRVAVVQVLMAWVLSGDRSVLEGLRFRPGLVATDAPLAAFMRQVNALPRTTADRAVRE
jgi:phenylpropionate dioxygenase-like ring-hydroxylating dioxygenase large terminal subunit